MDDLAKRQQELVDKPERTLITSLNTLFEALRLVQAHQRGGLDPSIFATEFNIVETNQPFAIHVKPPKDRSHIELALKNMAMNVAATCVIQHDELARQKLNGKGRFTHPDNDTRNSCIVLYLLRCAFAHNPMVPRWLIAPRFRDRVYEIPSIDVRLDTTGLHGTIEVVENVGGWVGAIRLMGHIQEIISPATARLMKGNAG